MRGIVLAASLVGTTSVAAAEVNARDSLRRVRPDVDLAMGFERCGAPSHVYARLQDELLFAVGAEDLLPRIVGLAGVEPGGGVEGLLVAVRGSKTLAIVPAKASSPPHEPAPAATPWPRRLDERLFAIGELGLLRDRSTTAAAPLAPPSSAEQRGSRCAWLVARPAWVRGDASPAPDSTGWSVLRSVSGIRSMTVTADFSAEVELTLRVTAGNGRDAAVLTDALQEFLASRRGNSGAPEAVRDAVERAAVERRSEVVTLRLPLSEAALNRIRRNADSRALLRLRLEDAERERWQRVADVVRALDVHEGDSVADVGAGDGFSTVRLADVVGSRGHVFAVEIGDKAVAALSRRASAASLENVEAILGAADDPRLPNASLDGALIVNAYHEMPSYEAMLARLFDALKPGGRLVLVEPWSKSRRGESRADQVKDHLIAPEMAEEELRRAGFAILGRDDDFISRQGSGQWLIQASRP